MPLAMKWEQVVKGRTSYYAGYDGRSIWIRDSDAKFVQLIRNVEEAKIPEKLKEAGYVYPL